MSEALRSEVGEVALPWQQRWVSVLQNDARPETLAKSLLEPSAGEAS